jgi:hypothetical protein
MRTIVFALSAALLIAALPVPACAQQSVGYLKTKIDPGRAGVFIDGKYVGPAGNFRVGRKYAVTPGEHEVRLSEPRYEDFVSKITIQAGKTVKLSQAMKPLPPAKPPFGRLRTMASDKYAAVYVNGKFMGHAGEFNNGLQGLQLNPGSYEVKIVPLNGAGGKENRWRIIQDR